MDQLTDTVGDLVAGERQVELVAIYSVKLVRAQVNGDRV